MLTIGIPTYRRPASLNSCLSSILASKMYENLEVVIAATDIDSSVDAYTEQLLAALNIRGASTRVLSVGKGHIAAKLAIYQESSGGVLLFVDDDIVLGPEYLRIAERFFDSSVAAVSGILVTPINTRNYIDWSMDKLKRADIEGRGLCNKVCYDPEKESLWFENRWQFQPHESKDPIEAEWLVGGAAAVRRALFTADLECDNEIYCEDLNWSYQLFQKGHKQLVDPTITAYHIPANHGGYWEDRTDMSEMIQRGLKHFVKKHGLGSDVKTNFPVYRKV